MSLCFTNHSPQSIRFLLSLKPTILNLSSPIQNKRHRNSKQPNKNHLNAAASWDCTALQIRSRFSRHVPIKGKKANVAGASIRTCRLEDRPAKAWNHITALQPLMWLHVSPWLLFNNHAWELWCSALRGRWCFDQTGARTEPAQSCNFSSYGSNQTLLEIVCRLKCCMSNTALNVSLKT